MTSMVLQQLRQAFKAVAKLNIEVLALITACILQVEKTNDCIGDEVAQKVSAMQNGEVIFLTRPLQCCS